MTYEELEARFAAWAVTQPHVRAVIVTGSRARGNADTWSDLDTLLFTTERERCVEDAGWLAGFGEIWVKFLETNGLGDPEWFVLYEGGVKLDVTLLAVEDAALDLDSLLARLPYKAVFTRGYKVLHDAHAASRIIPSQPVAPAAPPSAEVFEAVVSEFLLEAATTAKFIARGDFWRAQRWLGEFMRRCLLRVVEWHAQAQGRDTWYSGRFMEQWVDSRVIAALPQLFPAFEREGMAQALRDMLDLMKLIGAETAERFGLQYPAEAHEKIAASTEATLRG